MGGNRPRRVGPKDESRVPAVGLRMAIDWMEQIDRELMAAAAARGRGNEGQARVCARRATGIAISACLGAEEGRPEGASAYGLLQWLQGQDAFRGEIREAAARLTVRLTQDFKLPHPEDPLEDAVVLIDGLLGRRPVQPHARGEE